MNTTEEFDTIVGEDVEISGSISNTGSILINGKVKGDVTSEQQVVIGQQARVEGPVNGQNVQVAGQVHGSIDAKDTLELLPDSQVSGDIKAGILNIQPGAFFNGTSTMEVSGSGETAVEKPSKVNLVEEPEPVTSYGDDEEDAEKTPEDKKRKPKLELES